MDTKEKTKNHSKKFHGIPPKQDNAFRRNAEKNGNSLPAHDSVSILLSHSELLLVTDLKQCIKAQQSHAYSQKVKIANLKRVAETLTYVQEHAYDTALTIKSYLYDSVYEYNYKHMASADTQDFEQKFPCYRFEKCLSSASLVDFFAISRFSYVLDILKWL